MIAFSPSSFAALEIFERHATDDNHRRLAAWVRLQLIAEDIETLKQSIETDDNASFLEKEEIKLSLTAFDNILHDWEVSSRPLLNGR